MKQEYRPTFESSSRLARAFLASRVERATTLVVSGSLAERDLLKDWAEGQGLELRVESSWLSTAHDWQDESVASRVVAWADLACRADTMEAAAEASSPVLVIAGESDRVDLASVPPDGHMDILLPPYREEELIWRVNRATARAEPWRTVASAENGPRLVRGPIAFDEPSNSVLVFGRPVALRRAERAVLVYLMQRADRFVSARELQTGALGSHGSGSAARNQVYEVRSKLRALGLHNAIHHEPHRGYRLNWEGQITERGSEASNRVCAWIGGQG